MSGISLSGEPAPTGQATPPPTTSTTPPTTTTTPPAQTPPGSTGSTGDVQSGDKTSVWYSGIQDAELKSFAEKKGWKDAEAQLKSHFELEKAFSAKSAAGSPPADPKDYTFDVPTDLPQGIAYSDEFAQAFRGMAHASKLSPEQAKALHSAYVEFAKTSHAAMSEKAASQLGERVTKAAADLEAAFGAKSGTPAFNRNVELAKRAIRMTDPKMMDALRDAGVVVTVNGQDMVANATLFSAFAKMGQGMYAEDTLYGQPQADVNPFDAKTENMEQQAWYIKNDPAKAKLLIRAAGPRMVAMYSNFLGGA